MVLLFSLFFTINLSLSQDSVESHSCTFKGHICYQYTENENTKPDMIDSLEEFCGEGTYKKATCEDKLLGCKLTGHGTQYPFDVSVWYYDYNYNDARRSCLLSGGEFVSIPPK